MSAYPHPNIVKPVNPLCEYLKSPIGIDISKPRLSWDLSSESRGQIQTAYRIIVSASVEKLKQDIGDVWDSGFVDSWLADE